MRSCFAFTSFGFQVSITPNLRVVATLAPAAVTAACGHVPRGQWAFLDADTLEQIDQSACLVEPWNLVLLTRACADRIKHVWRRVRSLLARYHREALLKVFAPLVSLPSRHCDCCKRSPRTRRSSLRQRRAHIVCSPGRRRLDTGLRVVSCARHRLSVLEMLVLLV